MGSSQQRLTAATDTRLAVVINAAANLKAQLGELNELRERLRKELLSARKSPRPKYRNGHGATSRSSLEIDRDLPSAPLEGSGTQWVQRAKIAPGV
jgi:hypothetical protein